MGRAPCCDKASVKKGPWSPEEDAKLKSYIEQHGTGGNWIALPPKIGLRRCGKSCRLRWLNYLRPNIKHGGFSEEEDNIICSLYMSIGSRWSIIAAQLPGRTDNDIKNYWNTRLKKKLLGKQRKEQQARRAPCTTPLQQLKSANLNPNYGWPHQPPSPAGIPIAYSIPSQQDLRLCGGGGDPSSSRETLTNLGGRPSTYDQPSDLVNMLNINIQLYGNSTMDTMASLTDTWSPVVPPLPAVPHGGSASDRFPPELYDLTLPRLMDCYFAAGMGLAGGCSGGDSSDCMGSSADRSPLSSSGGSYQQEMAQECLLHHAPFMASQ